MPRAVVLSLVLTIALYIFVSTVLVLSILPGTRHAVGVDVPCGTWFLTIGAMLTSVLVGWKWGVPAAVSAIEKGGYGLSAAPLWGSLLRYIRPIAILILLSYGATQGANW